MCSIFLFRVPGGDSGCVPITYQQIYLLEPIGIGWRGVISGEHLSLGRGLHNNLMRLMQV